MPDAQSIPKIGAIDEALLALDVGFFGAFYRGLIGFATIPTMRLLMGDDGSNWTLVPFLLFVLLLLRIVLAVVRKVVPFTSELQEAWSVRRRMAKLYDSYQWRKLLWIGAGMTCYVVFSGWCGLVPSALSIFCLVAGASATVRWRIVSTDPRFPKPTARKTRSALG